jgi:hypothetical protein
VKYHAGRKHKPDDQITRDQAADLIAGLGPDRIAAILAFTFGQMIWAAILAYELQTDAGEDKKLRATANEPAYELLLKLFQRLLMASPGQDGAKPIKLAHEIRAAIHAQLQRTQSRRLIEDTLRVLGSTSSPAVIQGTLLISPIARSPNTIKKSLMDAAKGLRTLGLVEIHGKRKGGRSVTESLELTERGFNFMSKLIEHAIDASVEHYPVGQPTAGKSTTKGRRDAP